MPVYDYKCSDCRGTYDVFHKGHEIIEDIVCPCCGSKNYKKLMSVPVVSMGSNSSSNIESGSCGAGGCCGGGCNID